MTEWKETEIGLLPSHWRLEPIENLIEDKGIAVGVMYPGEFTSDGIPLIRAGDVRNNNINQNINYRISKQVNNNYKRTILEGGELLVVLVGNPGLSAVVPDEMKGWNVARAIGVLKLNDKQNGKYISYALRHPYVQHNLIASCNTTVQPTLNLKELKEISIPWPEKSIRHSIAETLSSLDDKIDLLHRQNKTLEQLAEAMFRQWFVEEAEEGWENDSLANIMDLQRGISYSSSTLGELDEGLPMHSLNSIDITGTYKYDGIKFYKGDVKPKQILAPGDLLIINTDMTQDNRIIGWPILVPDDYAQSVCTHHLYQVNLRDKRISKKYLFHLLRQREYRDALANASNGTTVSMLSKQAIEDIHIKIPPSHLRISFENHTTNISDKQSANHKQIRTLTQLRDSLLPKLMSGEVRVFS
ncbi:MAG: restriction endonuclease subunit S [Flavobacteriales bacterium]